MRDEDSTEAAIVAAGATAPRLTPEMIDSKIKSVSYHLHEGTALTLCILELANGFTVIGKSAPVSPENYRQDIGEKIAYDNARNEIWQLEGYLLREQMHLRADLGAVAARTSEVMTHLDALSAHTAIAQICHEANRGYCLSLGDTSQVPWDEAPEWQKQSAIAGVAFIAANPDATPRASHESWLEDKRLGGWRYGPVKDTEAKTHPAYMPYDDLPPEIKAKDYIFGAIVRAAMTVR